MKVRKWVVTAAAIISGAMAAAPAQASVGEVFYDLHDN
jgi:hypothetical protein